MAGRLSFLWQETARILPRCFFLAVLTIAPSTFALVESDAEVRLCQTCCVHRLPVASRNHTISSLGARQPKVGYSCVDKEKPFQRASNNCR